MFSGIIKGLGEIKGVENFRKGLRIHVDIKGLIDVDIGDSVAINGVCLTVVRKNKVVSFELMPETLKRTNLGLLKIGDKVNVEGSLKVCDRIGGHFVTGHIDAIGKIVKIEGKDFKKLWISAKRDIINMLIPKGSVALDGVSMTIVDIKKDKFSVCCIPHTLKLTTLGLKDVGDLVNIEIDMIGKWVKKIIEDMDLKYH